MFPPAEAAELGLWAAFETALCLVEWPERLEDTTPHMAAHLHFGPGAHPDQRIPRISVPDGSLAQALRASAATNLEPTE